MRISPLLIPARISVPSRVDSSALITGRADAVSPAEALPAARVVRGFMRLLGELGALIAPEEKLLARDRVPSELLAKRAWAHTSPLMLNRPSSEAMQDGSSTVLLPPVELPGLVCAFAGQAAR
jgi:hypothetical protein